MRLIKEFLDSICEFLAEISYIGYMLSICLIICLFSNSLQNCWIYPIVIVLNIISIYVASIKLEDCIYFREKSSEPIVTLFIAFNFILFIISSIIGSWVVSSAIFTTIIILLPLLVYVTESLICVTVNENCPLLETLFAKAPLTSTTILLLLPILAVAIPTILLPINIFLKLLIILGYIVSIPFIASMADSGFCIEDVVEEISLLLNK